MLTNKIKIKKPSFSLPKFKQNLSNRIGIDLGTANTVAHIDSLGVIVNEPTILAYNKKTNQVTSFGKRARNMLGRAPKHIDVIQPLSRGIVSDFEGAEEILRFVFNKADEVSPKLLGPQAVIGVPSEVGDIEIQIVRDVAIDSGARSVHIVPEPYAVAVGMDLFNKSKHAFLVIDIGGGTTDIMIFSFDGIVASTSINTAGQSLNNAILETLEQDFHLSVGARTVDELKITALISPPNSNQEFAICGRDTKTQLPKEVVLSERHIRQSVFPHIRDITLATRKLISYTPPEISADLKKGKIYVAGGGALLKGFPQLLSKSIGVPVVVAPNPFTIMAEGASKIASEIDKHTNAFLETGTNKTMKF